MDGFYCFLLCGHDMWKNVLAPKIVCTQNACTFCLFAAKIVCQNWEEMLCLKSFCHGKNCPVYPRHFYQYFSKEPALENYTIFYTLQRQLKSFIEIPCFYRILA